MLLFKLEARHALVESFVLNRELEEGIEARYERISILNSQLLY